MSIENLVDAPPPPAQASQDTIPPSTARKGKRKASPKNTSRKKANTSQENVKEELTLITPEVAATSGLMPPPPVPDVERALVPAKLTFSFTKAKQHLIRVDPRFEDLFERLKCKPFEHLEQFDPFR